MSELPAGRSPVKVLFPYLSQREFVDGAVVLSEALVERTKELQRRMFEGTVEKVPGFQEDSEELRVILKEGKAVTLQGRTNVQLYRAGKTVILRHPNLEEVGSRSRSPLEDDF